ncbi:MAG TPA: hypothetical protein VFU22_31380 [Roseiflexaceae bacterium]|nr:hypothetical protein [Roseiflexaceae bacterium]
MYRDDINEYGCPLRDQTGSVAVQNFDLIIGLLAPELRAAFEAERADRQAELELYCASSLPAEREATDAIANRDFELSSDGSPPDAGQSLLELFEQWLGSHSRPHLRQLLGGLWPRVAAQ